MKKVIIIGIIILIYAAYFLFQHSFTKYNQSPRKLVEQYLEEHYGNEFQLISSEYVVINGYPGPYLWKFRYRDEEGREFSIQCSHPDEDIYIGYCTRFYDDCARIDDYYWRGILWEKYGQELELKKYVTVEETETYGPGDYTYRFYVNTEEEMKEAAELLARLTVDTLKNVKVPSKKVFSVYAYYKGDYIYDSAFWLNEVYENYADSSEEELYEFFYNKMLEEKKRIDEKGL